MELRIVKSFQIFKYQLVSLFVISDFEPVQPFSFDKGMKRLNTCIIPSQGNAFFE